MEMLLCQTISNWFFRFLIANEINLRAICVKFSERNAREGFLKMADLCELKFGQQKRKHFCQFRLWFQGFLSRASSNTVRRWVKMNRNNYFTCKYNYFTCKWSRKCLEIQSDQENRRPDRPPTNAPGKTKKPSISLPDIKVLMLFQVTDKNNMITVFITFFMDTQSSQLLFYQEKLWHTWIPPGFEPGQIILGF